MLMLISQRRSLHQRRVTTNMIVDRAELQTQHFNSAEMMTDVQLIRGADAAMDLDGSLRRQTSEATHMGLRRGYGALSSRRLAIQAECRRVCD